MARFIKRNFSKTEIDRAGELLGTWWKAPRGTPDAETTLEIGMAYGIAQNWRTCHGLPLNVFQAILRGRAQRVEQHVLVAQRLKRFSSMMNKLVREPQMKLSQMQDLGGCRAILSDISAVNRLWDFFGGNLLLPEPGIKCKDYIKHPKPDGYRGIHIIGRYVPRKADREPWNGQRIEVQLRTRLQHAFATAVETVTTFTRRPLKFGGGPEEWRRFFSLTGSLFAMREGTPLVYGTPTNPEELVMELREISKTLKVRQRLRGWTKALQTLPRQGMKNFKWLLLVLNTTDNTIKVRGFEDPIQASDAVESIEREKRDDLDAVLVWVRSAKDLRAAYPNYYADTSEFIEALDAGLGFPRRKQTEK